MDSLNQKTSFFDKLVKKLETQSNQRYQEDINNLIGALIKRKREFKRLTQSEVSEDICSISYLSKIEANKVPINEVYSALLMERLEISKKDIILLENANEYLNKALEYFYSINKDAYLNLFYDVEDAKESLAAEVIKFGFYILINDNEKAESTFDYISKSLKSLDNLLLKIFALFSCEFLLKKGEYETVIKTISVLEREFSNIHLFNVSVKDFIFRLYAKTNRCLIATEYYYDLLNEYIKEVNQPRIFFIKSIYLFMLLENGEYDKIISEEKNVKYLTEYYDANAINYLFGYAHFETGNYSISYSYFDKIKEDSKYFYKMLLVKYEHTSEKEELYQKALELNKKYNNFYLTYLIKKHTNKLSSELFKTKEHNEAFIESNIKERVDLYLLEVDYYSSVSRYKEAYLITKKINQLTN